MRQISIEDVTETKEVVKDVFCNKCGASCLKVMVADEPPSEDYSIHVEFSTGYCSDDLWDGHYFRFDLCEKCIKDLMLSFLHPPETKDYMDGGDMWRPATKNDLRAVPVMRDCFKEVHGQYDAAKHHHGCPKCEEENKEP